MTHLIIGTAGHVDHGKTMLVKALTGVDTDRLKEEKERGISIELGFASLTLPSGLQAGIVDVPGHERFIKNMLAGVGGIDLVLLVIAADEGVMPQTKEHMDIIQLLQIPRGVVVITKVDLVDREWLDLVREEIKDFLKGTTLEDAPMVEVSSITGQGLDELLRAIDLVAQKVKEKPATGHVRLPVDRVFSVTGFGTVVTGTLWSGVLHTGDALEIMPRRIASRARMLQVHGQKVEKARAGQRVAINLTGVEVEAVPRGSVVATPGILTPSYRMDVRLILLESARPLKNRARVRLHLGTAEIMCRVILLDREELVPGDTAPAQLELEEPAVALQGDRFVIRSYSPVRTIGGGKIIDPVAPKHRRMRTEVIEKLLTREKGTPEEILLQQLNSQQNILTAEELARASGFDEQVVTETMQNLVKQNRIRTIPLENQVSYLPEEVYRQWAEKIRSVVQEYHREFPLREGFPREEMRSRFFTRMNNKHFQALLQVMEEDNLVKLHAQEIALPEFTPQPERKLEQKIRHLLEIYKEANYQPPAWIEATRQAGLDGPMAQEILQYLLKKGLLVRVADDLYFHAECLDKARQELINYLREKGEITVGETRDLLQTSRKYALPLLEYFDREKTTKRVGDKRVLTKVEKQKIRL